MNIEAFKWFRKKKDNEARIINAELEQRTEEMERKAKSLIVLKKTQGWKEVDKYINDNIKLLRDKRDVLHPGSDEDITTHADIKAWSNIKRFVDNWGTER